MGVTCTLVVWADFCSVHPTVMTTVTQIREEPAAGPHVAFKACEMGETGQVKTENCDQGQVCLSVLRPKRNILM